MNSVNCSRSLNSPLFQLHRRCATASMAARTALKSDMLSRPTMQLSMLSRRSLTTLSQRQAARSTQQQSLRAGNSSVLRQSFRRGYADAAPPPKSPPPPPPPSKSPSPAPKPKRRLAGLFKWSYRLMLLSMVGGSAWLAYNIYDLRNPDDQAKPDPKKKTLVILGMESMFIPTIN